jgi:kynurenine formamidase
MSRPPRFLDLSHDVVAGMTTYPGLPGPVITDHLSWEASHHNYAPGVEFQIGRIDMVANTGTYLDTPAHRFRGGMDLSGLPLESIAAVPGVLVSTTDRAVDSATLTEVDVSGRAVLVHTGWSRLWGTEEYRSHDHPYLTEDAAEYLVSRGAALVGIDSMNIDATTGGPGPRPVHTRLLRAGIPIVEHLTGLDQLIGWRFSFFAVPVKVRGMGSFPVRAFAVVE